MKNLIIIILMMIQLSLFAQVPESVNYLAVARDSTGNVLRNREIRFRISILTGSLTGEAVYREGHVVTTNDFGIVTLAIGKGNPISGDFTLIGWGDSTYFLETEMDPDGGTDFQLMGVSQFLSVPYALYAKHAGTVTQIRDLVGDTDSDTKVQTEKNADEDKIRFDLGGRERWIMDGARLEPRNSGNSVFIGEGAGVSDDLQDHSNIFVGYQSGYNNTTGSANTGCGAGTLFSTVTGSDNTAIGRDALSFNTTGNENMALGRDALYFNDIGSANTAVGRLALLTNTAGNANTAIGYFADVSDGNLSNTTAIGNGAVATTSDQVRLGNGSVASLYCQGAYASTTSSPANLYVDPAGQIMRSTSKGPVLPRISKGERDAMDSPEEGLMVFCTNCGTNGSLSIFLNNKWSTFMPCSISSPVTGIHEILPGQITWKWNPVEGATGYKWNMTDSYDTATDLGTATIMAETGLTLMEECTRYVWAYSSCGVSEPLKMTGTVTVR